MKRLLAALGWVFLIVGSLCAEDKMIQLQYKPKSEISVRIKNLPPIPVYFEDVKDTRPHPQIIGENQEDRKKTIRILTESAQEVKSLVQEVLKNELRFKGMKIENHPQTAEKTIGASLLRFWTLETRTYDSETELLLEIKDKTGQVFFKKTYSGTGKNKGRSLSEVNYQESISESLNRLIEGILSDPEFLAALTESRPNVQTEPPPSKPLAVEKMQDPTEGEKHKKSQEAEEKALEEKRLQDIREAERRLEEKRLEEQKAAEKRLEEIRAVEKRLEELQAEIKRLEEKKAHEKRMEEIRAEEKRMEEIREEVRRLEEKKVQENTPPSLTSEAQPTEEKTPSAKGKAKKPAAPKTPPKGKDPYFGPK